MTLFKECLEALKTKMLSEDESAFLSEMFVSSFPITKWGKIDWDKIKVKANVECEPEILFQF